MYKTVRVCAALTFFYFHFFQTSLFSDYRIESQHHNEINFFFKIPDLLHITKDLSDVTRIQVGLKRRGEQNIILFRWTGLV